MKKHLYRTIANTVIISLSLILVYPTIGWMVMSQEQRDARKKIWDEEDAVPHEPSYWADNWRTVKRWSQCDVNQIINLGLDLQGGIHMVLGLDPETLAKLEKEEGKHPAEVQEMVLEKIRRRVDEFEAKEPIIAALGSSQIQVQLPGEKDINRAKNLIMKTAYLTFHIVSGVDETDKVFKAINDHFQKRFIPYLDKPVRGAFYAVKMENAERVRDLVNKAKEVPGLIPEDKTIAFSPRPNPWDKQLYTIYLMSKDAEMSGENLKRAVARADTSSGANWMILFENNAAGAARFGEVTDKHRGKPMAIVLDGLVVSAPTIQGRITSNGQITGDFSTNQAKDLAIALNSGAMPVPLKEEYTGVVGASLGADTIRKGVISSVIGVACVVIFMIWYYRVAGLIANIGLVVNALTLLATMAYFNATLTLPGIAGFILTMGMAVDANVLIFERIREELRNGKSLLAAIDGGYTRAMSAILDSNVTTLIAGVVLLQFGTGPVQGFAVSLCIGIVTSVYSSLVVTRAVFDFLAERRLLTKLTMVSLIPPDTKFPFIEWRKVAFAISGVTIVAGMALFAIRGSDNFGVDFTSGTNMIVKLTSETPITVGAVRATLEKDGFKDATVQEYAEAEALGINQFVIRIGEDGTASASTPSTSSTPSPAAPPSADDTGTISGRVQVALAALCANPNDPAQVILEQVNTVGPAVGAKLKTDAVLANVYSWLFIIIYLWVRYEFKFGVAAVIALIHDVLITVGALSLVGRQISMPVIAALLTVIGYSVNDTIVIFDRVREDLKLYRGRGYSLLQILNMSINQTLSRTILTSMTVFFVVIVLFFFGGISIEDFAFSLIVGVLVGTYSTIFVASAVVYEWQTRIKSAGTTLIGVKTDGVSGSSRKRTRSKGGAKEETEATV